MLSSCLHTLHRSLLVYVKFIYIYCRSTLHCVMLDARRPLRPKGPNIKLLITGLPDSVPGKPGPERESYGLSVRQAHQILAVIPMKKKSSPSPLFSPLRNGSRKPGTAAGSLFSRQGRSAGRHVAPAFFGSFPSAPQANCRFRHRLLALAFAFAFAFARRRARPPPPALRCPGRRLRGSLRRVAPPQGHPPLPLFLLLLLLSLSLSLSLSPCVYYDKQKSAEPTVARFQFSA